ncbi:MAG: DUF222 domain-containing protein, partial [Pseudonocardiaceae bacterium]
ETRLDPRQAMAACLAQWRHSIVEHSDARLQEQVRDIESVLRMLYSVMLETTTAELDSRDIAGTAGFRSTKQLLAGMLNLSPTEAGARVAYATQLAPRRTLGGEVLAPLLPNTAAALAAGEIGPGQVRVITDTMAAIPAGVSATDRDAAEAELAGYARSFNPTSLHTIARHIVAHLDPDGPEPRDEPESDPAAGELRLCNRRDWCLGLEGYLEPEHSAAFRSLIEQLAGPHPATAIPDARTTAQRNADALLEVCGLARAAEDCPSTAGEPPHLTVTIDWDALRTGLGVATLDYGTHISAAEARRWACDAKIIPLVMGGKSEPLDVGRAMRTVPLAIRRALVARDRGCAFPGCDRPPAMCHAHHCRHWIDLGETSVENCVLLCEAHHRHVHRTGWEILIRPSHVEFIPPAIIDPTRTPIRNPLRC